MIVAGADGCLGGWVVVYGCATDTGVTPGRAVVVPALDEIDGVEALALDIPIGLNARAEPGGRACDRAARAVLGPRKSSVFSAPASGVLGCATYPEALAVSRASSEHGLGLTKQCWNIVPKIREAEAFAKRGRVRTLEAHPEVCFARMGGAPMEQPKRSPEGRAAREAALVRAIGAVPDAPGGHQPDDLLDACACLWTAWRVVTGRAERFPAEDAGEPGVIWA